MSLNIKALKESAEKATPGPWRVQADPCHYDSRSDICSEKAVIAQTCGEWEPMEPNAAFIALANPSTILSLIERVEELEGALREVASTFDEESYPRVGSLERSAGDKARAALSKADATP